MRLEDMKNDIEFNYYKPQSDSDEDAPRGRMAADRWPESYPLYDSVNADLSGDFFTHSLLQSAISLHRYSRIFYLQLSARDQLTLLPDQLP